jgi:lysophospholipase L1-like esterase
VSRHQHGWTATWTTHTPADARSAFSTRRSEAKRAAVNAWIRGSGEYDAVIDLAQAMGERLDPAHDSGDNLHPNDAGYRAMAAAIDLTLLERQRG